MPFLKKKGGKVDDRQPIQASLRLMAASPPILTNDEEEHNEEESDSEDSSQSSADSSSSGPSLRLFVNPLNNLCSNLY